MDESLFGSELWNTALDKYAEVTGLSVELFGVEGQTVLGPVHPTPLVALFRENGFEPGLVAECARRCLSQADARPAVAVAESHGLTVIGTSLVLEGTIVGAAVAGYALAGFSRVVAVRRWARSSGLPFERLWDIVRRQPPVPERRLMLHGELLQTRLEKLQAIAAAKDEFLAMLSHELRTPLAPILGWASVLKNEGTGKVRRAAEAIERNVRLQSRMVDDLLDMNRIAQGKVRLDLEILELATLIRAALETSAQDIEKKAIRLEIVQAGGPLFVEGDAGRLQQVFANIFSNAVKFTPTGGSIRVALSREADSARVVVADTGAGIAPEFLPFVFDIFRQQEQGTRRGPEGLGIGLALVKRLTELHKGTVSVASAGAGRGTEVAVQLPLAAQIPDLDGAASAGTQPGTLALAGLSILVVEDSDDTRESLRALLQLLGAEVSAARDGREALDRMKRGTKPDVVLCDLLMPRMDGFEFIRELDGGPSLVHPPVVALSGLASETSRRRTQEAGFCGHIKKPFDEAAVVAAVNAALSQRQERQVSSGD